MLHVCVQRFDVTENLKILAKFLASKRCLSIFFVIPIGNYGIICWLLLAYDTLQALFECRLIHLNQHVLG
jgi:hypothetical protein